MQRKRKKAGARKWRVLHSFRLHLHLCLRRTCMPALYFQYFIFHLGNLEFQVSTYSFTIRNLEINFNFSIDLLSFGCLLSHCIVNFKFPMIFSRMGITGSKAIYFQAAENHGELKINNAMGQQTNEANEVYFSLLPCLGFSLYRFCAYSLCLIVRGSRLTQKLGV